MISAIYLGDDEGVFETLLAIKGVKLEACIHEKRDEVDVIRRLAAPVGLPLFAVDSHRQILKIVAGLQPIDIGVVANFGLILDAETIASTRLGYVNIHLGLLPERPGRHPIRNALAAGDDVVGVTLHGLIPKVDAGPVIGRRTVAVGAARDPVEIHQRLVFQGREMLKDFLESLCG